MALIGCGGFSRGRVQPALESGGLLQPVACYDVDGQATRQAAERFGARPCGSFGEAVETGGVEAVLLITPNHVHREQAEAALAAGKHVFVEKPIANTAADGIAMTRAAERAGRVLMVGHHARRQQPFRLVKQLIDSGRLGQPISGEGHFSSGAGKHLAADAWRADPKLCPGLPINVIGCHMIDILNMCFGVPRTVAAFHRRAIVPTNDDCTTTIIAYQEPVTATLASHYCTPPVHDLRVVGTEAIAEVHNRGTQLVIRRSGAEPEVQEYPKRLSITAEFEIFARAIRHGEPVETDGRCGVLAIAVVEASNISARENRFVETDEIVGDFLKEGR